MLATAPMNNSRYLSLSTEINVIVGKSYQCSSFSVQPFPTPPGAQRRLHPLVLCRCFSSRSSFSLREDGFALPAQDLLDCAQKHDAAEEDLGLEQQEKKKKVSPYLASIVKVLCKKSPPDYLCPRRREPKYTTSSGFIVRGRKVLTCAHSVDNHIMVQLKKPNSDTLYTAIVLSVALECDLALLTVDDDKFWEGVVPVHFAGMPAVQDKLAILGYPNGNFSMTTTCVSRVSMVNYRWTHSELLGVKVDVAIEDGVSGSPVFSKSGECVGMAFQSCKEGESDIIAAPVICHFLEDYFRNGAYTGFPSLGIVWQDMENPDLRLFMKMGHGQQGILIIEVKPNYPEYEILKPNDIILSIDGINVGNDGTVPFTWGQRIPFSYLITKKYTGDAIDIRVLRNSEIQEYSIVLTTPKQFKPANIRGRPFPYYILAGFVFTTLSIPYLRSKCGYGLKNISNELISQALYEERVVISKVLTIDGYDGMDDIENAQVLNVNGMPVQNLKSLKRVIESCNEEFLEFILDNQKVLNVNGMPVQNLKSLKRVIESCNEEFLEFILDNQKKFVLHTSSAKARTPSILKMHNIPSAMSDDLCIPKG